MMTTHISSRIVLSLLICLTCIVCASQTSQGDQALVGLWKAARNFDPETSGLLTVTEKDGVFSAEISGRRAPVLVNGSKVTFAIPAVDAGVFRGAFAGAFQPGRATLSGHWTQPKSKISGQRFASPVILSRVGDHQWVGEIHPNPDQFTLFLKLQEREDGTVGAFLRNPERNIGVFLDLDHIEREGKALSFFGKFRGRGPSRVLVKGRYDENWDRIMMDIPNRGGTYVFERITEDQYNSFYARAKNPKPFTYAPPPARNDGWRTGTLLQAGIDIEPIKRLIENEIDAPIEDVHASYVHGILIARNGKVVFEEYFHGFHRDKAHDTRSASKSLTSTLIGAAIDAGLPISTTTPVFGTMLEETSSLNGLDPRKDRMTLEHLLTMSSGFYCDDSDSEAPGGEDRMQEQENEPDWYRYTLSVPMAYEPGEIGIYCSANSNLAGGVLSRATETPLETLFQDLIASPLQMDRYHLNLSPTGEPYMGGGIHLLPRDFLKLGQVMLDDGIWNGRRIVSREWAKKATSALIKVRDRDYGYQWWVREYEYQGKSLPAFFAGGNGGNIVVVVPDLDVVIAFFGGNYADRVLYRAQDEFIPNYILPAISAK